MVPTRKRSSDSSLGFSVGGELDGLDHGFPLVEGDDDAAMSGSGQQDPAPSFSTSSASSARWFWACSSGSTRGSGSGPVLRSAPLQGLHHHYEPVRRRTRRLTMVRAPPTKVAIQERQAGRPPPGVSGCRAGVQGRPRRRSNARRGGRRSRGSRRRGCGGDPAGSSACGSRPAWGRRRGRGMAGWSRRWTSWGSLRSAR